MQDVLRGWPSKAGDRVMLKESHKKQADRTKGQTQFMSTSMHIMLPANRLTN